MAEEFADATRFFMDSPRDFAAESPAEGLVRAVQNGDAAAFEALMREHEIAVYRTAYRLLGNREDALDALQEVFLRIYRFKGRIDGSRPLVPFLYTVTVNVCRDAARKRLKHRNLPAAAAGPAASDPSKPAIKNEVISALERALANLPERERIAVVLRDIEGLTTREVAEVMGTTEVTVRSHISRAHAKLKRYRDEVLGS